MCLLFSRLFLSIQQWWLIEHLLCARHHFRHWKDHNEQAKQDSCPKVPIPDVEGRDSQYTQETNKIILERDKCSEEILKVNELECGGGMGEGPLRRWGGTNPVKIWGESSPGMGRAGAKSPSQDQGWDSLGTERLSKLRRGESGPGWSLRYQQLAEDSTSHPLYSVPWTLSLIHSPSNMTTPPASLHPPSCPVSGIWHKIMIQQMPAGWMNPLSGTAKQCLLGVKRAVLFKAERGDPTQELSSTSHTPLLGPPLSWHPPLRTPSSKVSETLWQGLLGRELSLFLRNMTGKLWLFRPVQVRKPEGSRNIFPLTLLIQIQQRVCYYVKVQIHMFISKVSAILAFLYVLIFNQCLRYQQP